MTCCVVYRSGGVLSLELPSHGAVSAPRPGPEHDERRLRFLHVLSAKRHLHQHAVDRVEILRRERFPQAPSSFLRRQTGSRLSHNW